MGEYAGTEAVIDVDDRRAGGAGVEHGEECGEPPEAGSVPDTRGNGDERLSREPSDHAGEGPIHSRHHDEDPGRLKLAPLVEHAVESCYPHIVELLDPAP